MLTVVHSAACLTSIIILLHAHLSKSYLHYGRRLKIKPISSNYLKMSDKIEDLVMFNRGASGEFDADNDNILEKQNVVVFANEFKVDDASLMSNPIDGIKKQRKSQFVETTVFLLRAAVVGVMTGGSGLAPEDYPSATICIRPTFPSFLFSCGL